MGGEPAAHHRPGIRNVLLSKADRGAAAGMLRLGDGTGIRIEQAGSGTPLVLIPGWACSIGVFQHHIPAFAEHFRVIAYDPRSQGDSLHRTDDKI